MRWKGLRKLTGTQCFALLLLSAMASGATEHRSRVESAGGPTALGTADESVFIAAATILQWPEGDATCLDLRGRAAIFQGRSFVRAPRLFVRIARAQRLGLPSATLHVFGERGTLYQDAEGAHRAERPSVFLFRTTNGVALEGKASFGDRPPEDPFLRRARAWIAGKPDTSLPKELPEHFFGDVRPSAEEMLLTDLSDDGVTITLQGNAEIAARDFLLTADVIRLRVGFTGGRFQSPQARSLYAEGAVDLQSPDTRVTARSIYLDLIAEEGVAAEARLRGAPAQAPVALHVYAEAVRQVSRYRFVCETPAFFSTSQSPRPAFRVESRHVELVRGPARHRLRAVAERRAEGGREPYPGGALVTARDNVAYAGPLPLLYWPFAAKDVTSGTFLIRSAEVGQSSNLGTFVRAAWNLYDLGILYNSWSDLTLLTDFYSNRGAGIGLNLEYDATDREGFARAYYIRDHASDDDRALSKPQSDRGELTLRHRERDLPFGFEAILELGYLSDRNFLRVYDRDELDEAKDRETLLYLSRSRENTLLTAQTSWRINDFQNALERHAVAFHIFAEPLFDTSLLWTSHTELARLQTLFDDDLRVKDPDGVTRLDTLHEISWPFDIGPVRLAPYLKGDLTAFSERPAGLDSAARVGGGYGLRAATNFYRTYLAESELLDVDRLRHIITPTLEYENYQVSHSPSRYIQNDEIDARDDLHRARLGLRNRLQTYRFANGRREIVDFLVFDLDYILKVTTPNAAASDDDSVEANLLWRINDHVTFRSTDNRYNVDDGTLERLNGAITLDYWRPLVVTLSQNYYRDTARPGRPEHNVSRLSFSYRPAYSRWRVELRTGYDFKARRRPGDTRDPSTVETAILVHRQIDDWEVGFGAEFDVGRRSETRLTVTLVPPGRAEPERSYR